MIPSDHFVRFYNEVFKFLDARDGLAEYYREISRHQDFHCLELFRSRGLRGVYEYYQQIRVEENCELELVFNGEHELRTFMSKCPSLTKALDNDAGACRKYCLHCPGWVLELYRRAGIFCVYDLQGLDEPLCRTWLFDRRELAEVKYRELLAELPADRLFANFNL